MGIAEKVFKVMESKVKVIQGGYGNLVNSIAPEPLKGLDCLTVVIVVGRRTGYVFKVTGSKVKVIETFARGGIQSRRRPSCYHHIMRQQYHYFCCSGQREINSTSFEA